MFHKFFIKNLQIRVLKNETGQSAVEYIMLLAVVVFLTSVVFNSDIFKEYLGDNGKIFQQFERMIEYTYRYTGAYNPSAYQFGLSFEELGGNNHPSYHSFKTGALFFSPEKATR